MRDRARNLLIELRKLDAVSAIDRLEEALTEAKLHGTIETMESNWGKFAANIKSGVTDMLLEEAIKTLQFYADLGHWDGDRLLGDLHDYGDETVIDDVYGDRCKPSGKRARETLLVLNRRKND